MKAVILAAGRGKRMMPLTTDTPKPLLKVRGKALIDYTLDLLPEDVSEIIIVVHYLGDQIAKHMKVHHPHLPVRILWQEECNGTAKALELAKPYLKRERFVLLFSDDLHSKDAVLEAAKHDLAIVAKAADLPERFGVLQLDNTGFLREIVEKPEKPATNLVNVGIHVLDDRIFKYRAPQHPNGEYYVTDMINQLAKEAPVAVVKTDFWLPIGYPEDIKKAEDILKK
jgi:bifunctional UDP-N-acetylglucosamine pyrophosphorylase/glucosamine-1-phosphate N-acetyltransferase